MPSPSDNEEIPLPLVRRIVRPSVRRAAEVEADVDERSRPLDLSAIPDDRMSPSVAGGIMGLLGGLAAFGVVHALRPEVLTGPMIDVADARRVELVVAFAIAYATAAAIGALVGATFAVVTRYLRKWGPLLVWALVFFVSLAMLLLAVSSAYGRGVSPVLSGPILAASAAYAVVVSFSWPLRRRR